MSESRKDRRIAVLMAGAVLIGLAVFLARSREPADEGKFVASSSPTPIPTSGSPKARRSPEAGGAVAIDSAVSERPDETSMLHVRVVSDTGGWPTARSGARVTARSAGGAAREGRTDAFGRLTLAELEPGAWTIRCDLVEAEFDLVLSGEPESLEIVVPVAVRTLIRVKDFRGGLVPGAEIWETRGTGSFERAPRQLGVTDEKGEFVLEGIPRSGRPMARHWNLGCSGVGGGTFPLGGVCELRIEPGPVLIRIRTIGPVFGVDGTADRTLLVGQSERMSSIYPARRTGPDTWEAIASLTTPRFAVQVEDAPLTRRAFTPDPGEYELTLGNLGDWAVRVRVVDEEGLPVADAKLWADREFAGVQTDEEGRATFFVPEVRPDSTVVASLGFRNGRAERTVTRDEAASGEVTLVLGRRPDLRVEVAWDDGVPLAFVDVAPRYRRGDRILPGNGRRSDARGVATLPPGDGIVGFRVGLSESPLCEYLDLSLEEARTLPDGYAIEISSRHRAFGAMELGLASEVALRGGVENVLCRRIDKSLAVVQNSATYVRHLLPGADPVRFEGLSPGHYEVWRSLAAAGRPPSVSERVTLSVSAGATARAVLPPLFEKSNVWILWGSPEWSLRILRGETVVEQTEGQGGHHCYLSPGTYTLEYGPIGELPQRRDFVCRPGESVFELDFR